MATDYRQPPVRLQGVGRKSVRTLADPPKAPQSFDAFDRAACKALGLPYYKDVESRHGERVYHQVGAFKISNSEAAVEAVVQEYRRQGLSEVWLYTYREYLDALKRVGQTKNQLDRIDSWEEEQRERARVHDIRVTEWIESEDAKAPIWQNKVAPSEPEERDTQFSYWYSMDMHTPNVEGYLFYIQGEERVLYDLLCRGVPVLILEDPDKPHGYVLGTPGSGKSELFKILVHSFVSDPHYGSVVVLDPSNAFAGEVAEWKEFIASDRLVYLKPDLELGLSPVINPFEIYRVKPGDYSLKALKTKRVVADQLVEGLERLVSDAGQGSSLTLPMRALLRPCILALLDREGVDGEASTLRDLATFMLDKQNGKLVAFGRSLTHHSQAARYFAEGFYDGANAQTKYSIYRKLSYLLNGEVFAQLTCGKSTVELEKAVNEKKVIVFGLGKGSLADAGVAFARLVIGMLLGIAYRREDLPEYKRVPIALVVDECHNYMTESMREILTETRKFRLLLTLGQQVAGDGMSPQMKRLVLTTTSSQFTGGVPEAGAKENADLFGVEPEVVRTLEVGEFIGRARRQTEAFKFKTGTALLGRRNAMSDAVWQLIKKEQLRLYYRVAAVEEGGSPAPRAKTTEKADLGTLKRPKKQV